MIEQKAHKGMKVARETLEYVSEIEKATGISGFSAVVRYCIRQVYKQIQKESA